MGLFDFVKEAGQKLSDLAETKILGRDKEAAAEAGPVLEKAVSGHGIPVENLSITVENDVATVRGTTQSQADRERVILVAGNTEGIAKVDDQIEASTPEPPARFHTVVKGDSLSKIAKELYGDPMKYPVIFEANRPMLTDPDKIYPGQVLRIPNEDSE
jgi:nucleoid-associated protein YgaU